MLFKQEKSKDLNSFNKDKSSEQESSKTIQDARPEALAQQRVQNSINSSPLVAKSTQLQSMIDNSPRMVAQRQKNEELFGKAIQKKGGKEENLIQKKENTNSLPSNLKSGIENLSGLSMEDVSVHYNSPEPTKLQAHAFAQGTDIHVASGQEKHLPHEAWHVVQQKQGRVQPTIQKKSGVNINDDAGLEQEADVMGEKALQSGNNTPPDDKKGKGAENSTELKSSKQELSVQRQVIQLQWKVDEELGKAEIKKNLAMPLIANKQYDEAFTLYNEVKEIMKEIYQRHSTGRDQIFRRHTDKIDQLVRDIISSFQDTLQNELNSYKLFYKDLYTTYEGQFNQLYDQIGMDLLAKKDVTELNKNLSKLTSDHRKALLSKNSQLTTINAFTEKMKLDEDVSYDNGRDSLSTVPKTKLTPVSIDVVKEEYVPNNKFKNRFDNQKGDIEKTIASPEDDSLRENTSLLLLAGNKERKEALGLLTNSNMVQQLSLLTQINKYHRSDDIKDAVGLVNTIGIDNLTNILLLIDAVGAKGKLAEIKLYYDNTREVKGNPTIANLTSFLTGLEYTSLTNLAIFLKAIGKHGNLEAVKPIWVIVNTKNNLESTIEIVKEGLIPSTFTEQTLAVAIAFANRTGKSKAEDWGKLLKVKEWELENLLSLAIAYDGDTGNLTPEQWVETAEKHPELKTKPEEVRGKAYLNKYANDEWYDQVDASKLSSTDRSKKKYTQLLYALLGNKNLPGLGAVNFDTIKGDFLSMLVFFHKHIATFEGQQGQGFDREGTGSGKYARSNKDHPLNEQYKEFLTDESINVTDLLQPLNSSLLNLESKGTLSKDTRDHTESTVSGSTIHKGKISLASAGLPSHNLKMLQDQQNIVSNSKNKPKAKKKLFDAPELTTAPNQSRTLESKSKVIDGLVESQKTSLSGKILNHTDYNHNFHDSMLKDRGQLVSQLSTAINAISGGSRTMYAIGSEGHPSLVFKVPQPTEGQFYYKNIQYTSTKSIVSAMVTDFNTATDQNVKVTERGSFGFQRPTIADTGDSIRLWPGYSPVESLLPGLKVLVENLNSKTTPKTTEMTNMDRLTSITSSDTEPKLYVESLKTAMRHSYIALNKKIDDKASGEKKRVYEWLRTRMLIKLQQSGILLSKAATLYSRTSTASQQDKDKHFLVTADMTDKLQEYTMLYTASTLDNTTNPNLNHTETGKFKNSTDVYEQKLTSILSPTDYRIYYLDSGEQALIAAGILANRFEKGKDETDSDVAKSKYYNINPYFEIGEFSGDKRSNLEKGNNTSKIVHTDISPVITKDRTTPKSKTDVHKDTKETWQDNRGEVNRTDVIPIIDITNSSLGEVSNLGKMPNNFIIVESLTKHQQLGADKFIMGRLIVVSKTKGTEGGRALSKTNFLDLSQKIVGPVANEAYNPLLAQIRSNMDKALYSDELV